MSTATPPAGARVNLGFTREVTCIRALAWRCDLPVTSDWSALAAALEAAGLVPLRAVSGLLRFRSPTGDEILMVVATGRVQLRVHYTVPAHERRLAAERLVQILVRAWL